MGGNATVYLDGLYGGSINSYSADNKCTVKTMDFGNLTREPHNITVVNSLVLSGTAITDFAYAPYEDTTSTTSAPLAQATSTSISRTTLLPQSTPTPAITQSTSKASKGPIIGGVVAGVVVLIILTLLLIFALGRRSRQPNTSVSVGFNGAALATHGQEPKEQDFAPHDPSPLGYTGHSPQFLDPSPNVAPIVTPPISDSLRTDGAMPYGSSVSPFVANGRDTSTPDHDQRRVSIGSSPSSVSNPGSSRPLPVAPISQQQQQYRPDSFATRPTSGPSRADLVQQLVHTGVPAAEVVRMMGEVASSSSSGGARGAPVDEQSPPQYGDEMGGVSS
ncbi:hypothetical protein FRB93_009272 [Tulasnella sp. JGI-2019a]|nr:hypothetical protein FRB93_009272 [Tulasnella sp. JGI-2019a]